jgi:FixJ family two-component response regulator
MRAPVLLLTGYGEGLTESDLREAGVAMLLSKPVERQTLIVAVREWLSRSRAPGS